MLHRYPLKALCTRKWLQVIDFTVLHSISTSQQRSCFSYVYILTKQIKYASAFLCLKTFVSSGTLPLTMLNLLERTTASLIDKMVDDITHMPDGYQWRYSLPTKGRKSYAALKKHWRQSIYRTLFPNSLRAILLQVALTDKGFPDSRGHALYHWLRTHIYGNDTLLLYKEWCIFRQQKVHDND